MTALEEIKKPLEGRDIATLTNVELVTEISRLLSNLESLQRENEALRRALTPFAEASVWNYNGDDLMQGDRPAFPSDIDLMNLEGNSLTLCDLFDARDALASTGGEHHAE